MNAKLIAAAWLAFVAAYRLATIPPTGAALALLTGWTLGFFAVVFLVSAAGDWIEES